MDAFADFMGRVVDAVGSLESLLVGIAFLVGIVSCFIGIRALAATGGDSMGGAHSRQRAIGVSAIVGGSLVLGLPAFIDTTGMTLFGEATPNNPNAIFALAPEMLEVVSDSRAQEIVTGLLRVVQFIGAIAIFRAFSLFTKAPYHPGMGLYGRASTHLVGGALAWNIVLFTGTLEQLFIG